MTGPDVQIATESSTDLMTGAVRDNAVLNPSQSPTVTQPDGQIATESSADLTAGTARDNAVLNPSQSPTATETEPERWIAAGDTDNTELDLDDLLHDLDDSISAFDGATATQF